MCLPSRYSLGILFNLTLKNSGESHFRIFLQHLSQKWPIWFVNISNVYHQWLKEFFLYDFWQFNKSSWQIKWLCWQLNCTANQYFQLLSLSFRKNTTRGHTVVKPSKENKMMQSRGGGVCGRGLKLWSTTCNLNTLCFSGERLGVSE